MRRALLFVLLLFVVSCTDNATSLEDAGVSNTTDSTTDTTAAASATGADDGSAADDGEDDSAAGDAKNAPEGVGSAGLDDPYVDGFGNGGYDVSHYDLDLAWNPDDEQLSGVTTISAATTQRLTRFNLDLVGLTVEQVLVDGVAADFDHQDSELVITPQNELAQDQEFTVEVTYGGTPVAGSQGPGIAPSGWQTREDYSYVAGEPIAAATFHPANDHPSDKASFTYRITAPAELHVAANGTEKSVEENGETKTWTFEQPFPQTTYLTTILIGSFEVQDGGTSESGIPIRNVYDTALTDAASPAFDVQAEMIDEFEKLFGPYPFDVYGSAVVKDSFGGALETQTLSIFGQDVIGFGGFAEIIIAHELAHQWFGNSRLGRSVGGPLVE